MLDLPAAGGRRRPSRRRSLLESGGDARYPHRSQPVRRDTSCATPPSPLSSRNRHPVARPFFPTGPPPAAPLNTGLPPPRASARRATAGAGYALASSKTAHWFRHLSRNGRSWAPEQHTRRAACRRRRRSPASQSQSGGRP